MQNPVGPVRLIAPERHLFARFLVLVGLLASTATSQTLARPGWIGSGLTSQPWWQSAVIYRVQPAFFQDSDGNGVGDLRGLTQRLDYLQSIGVDAVLIESQTSDPGFDDLLSDASRHHVRVIVQLEPPNPQQTLTSDQTLEQARSWMRRGAAGVSVPGTLLSSIAKSNFQTAVLLLQELRRLADSFPGERIVISADSPAASAAAADSARSGPEMVDGIVNVSSWDAASLRTRLSLANSLVSGEPLLQIAPHSTQGNHERILSALLLSSRGAIAIPYGQEIGLSDTSGAAIMRWTPTNVTTPQAAAAPKPKEEVYGSYHPYIPPAPASMVGSRPRMPNVELNTESAPAPVDPNTLPGFSTKPVSTSAETAVNVATEDSNPDSLLNFYRRVLQLHSSNATLRTGSITLLNHDNEGALVWLRRAPAGARTVASVVVVCNLTDRAIELSLTEDLAHLHIAAGTLRPLLTSAHADHMAQPTGALRLSPHSVYIGELYHR